MLNLGVDQYGFFFKENGDCYLGPVCIYSNSEHHGAKTLNFQHKLNSNREKFYAGVKNVQEITLYPF